MHHVVALIAKRQGVHAPIGLVLICECYVPYVQGLMQNHHRAGGLTGSSLSIRTNRGKAVYILPSSDPTIVYYWWDLLSMMMMMMIFVIIPSLFFEHIHS